MTLISCPHCGKMSIEIKEIPNTILIKRGFTGRKGPQFFRGRDVYLIDKCPDCRKDPRIESKLDREKILKRMKESGLPTVIES